MRTLREMGWISEREVKNTGKGRPMKIYALRATIEKIIEHYEAEKNQESARTIEAIQRLKELNTLHSLRRPPPRSDKVYPIVCNAFNHCPLSSKDASQPIESKVYDCSTTLICIIFPNINFWFFGFGSI